MGGGGGRDGEDRLGKELLTIVSVAFFFLAGMQLLIIIFWITFSKIGILFWEGFFLEKSFIFFLSQSYSWREIIGNSGEFQFPLFCLKGADTFKNVF